MTSLDTELYATQRNGGKAGVTIGTIVDLAGENVPEATTTVPGAVLKAATVAPLTSVGPGTPAGTIVDVTVTPTQTTINANFASLATQFNALVASLKASGALS